MNKESIHNKLVELDVENFIIHDDLTVTVNGDCYLSYKGLTKLPCKFREIYGSFNCSCNKLTSLEGCPKEVHGHFWCDYNELTSLEGCPEIVHGNFNCSINKLKSLEHCPEVKGNFWGDDQLKSTPEYKFYEMNKKLS